MKNKGFWLAAVCGALTGLMLLLPQIGFLSFLTPIAAFYIIGRQTENKKRLLASALFSLFFCATGYLPAFGITTTLPPFYNLLALTGVYLVITLVHGAVYTAALYAAYSLPAFFYTRPLYVATLFSLSEWVIGIGPFAWPSLRISLSLYKYPLFIRLASVGGQLAVSALIIAVAALAAEAFLHKKNRRRILCAAAAALFVFNVIFGITAKAPSGKSTSVAVVQSGATVIDWRRGDVFEKTVECLGSAATADLYVLPESVLPDRFAVMPQFKALWETAADGRECLVGGRQNGHSAAYHLFGSDVFGVGEKSREVPIFENGFGNREFYFLPREYEGVFQTGIGAVGTLICYESMFSSAAQRAVDEEAFMLAVLTNDSWFDSTAAKNLHLAHGVFRAVESGRTLVQAGLNGHSAIIDRNGNMLKAENEAPDVITGRVYYDVKNTLYNKIGDWWLPCLLAAVVALSLIKGKVKK